MFTSADTVATRANSIIEGDEKYKQSPMWCSPIQIIVTVNAQNKELEAFIECFT